MNNSKESDSPVIKYNRDTENNKKIKLIKEKRTEINNNIKENSEKIIKTPTIEKNKIYSELKFSNNKNGNIKETKERKHNNIIKKKWIYLNC